MAHRILQHQIIRFSVAPLMAFLSVCPSLALGQTVPAPNQATAAAGPEDANAKAKKLMGEGNALYARRDFEGAHQKFLEAWAIKQHIAIASNLVETEMKLGQYGEAATRLRSLLSSMPMDEKDREAFMTQLAECRHHLVSLHITVSADGATVKVGDKEVGKSPLDNEVLVEPGQSRVTAELPGYQSETVLTDVGAAGELKNISLTLVKENAPPATAAAPAVSATTSAAPEARHNGIQPRTIVLIGGTALTVAGVGLGFVYLGLRANTDSEAGVLRAAVGSTGCSPGSEVNASQCAQLRTNVSRYDNQSNLMAGMFIGGGIAAAATIATYFLWPSRKASGADSASVRTAFVPWSSPNSAGLNVVSHF